MRRLPYSILFLAACSGVAKAPPGASPTEAPKTDEPSPSPVAETAIGSPSAPSDSHQPALKARTDAPSNVDWTLEGEGFPAVTNDGRLVALAFGEMNTTGPPVLSLTVEFWDVDASTRKRSAKFRQKYEGELEAGELAALRRRLTEWVASETAALAAHDLHPLTRVGDLEHPCDTLDLPQQELVSEPLGVRLRGTRLVVRHAKRRLIDQNHPEWVLFDRNNPLGNCVYRPALSNVYADAARRVLLIEVDYCSTGDSCDEGVTPRFAVLRLPAP